MNAVVVTAIELIEYAYVAGLKAGDKGGIGRSWPEGDGRGKEKRERPQIKKPVGVDIENLQLTPVNPLFAAIRH